MVFAQRASTSINFAPSPRVTLYAVPASEAADNGGDAYVAAEGRVHLGRYVHGFRWLVHGAGASARTGVAPVVRLFGVCLYLPTCMCMLRVWSYGTHNDGWHYRDGQAAHSVTQAPYRIPYDALVLVRAHDGTG